VPQGWTKHYEFSDADFVAASAIASQTRGSGTGHADSASGLAFLLGVLESAVYGGRLDAPADERTLRACLAAYLHQRVLDGSAPVPGTQVSLGPISDGGRVSADAESLLRAALANLPDTDAPGTLCLAANVDRAAQEVAARSALQRVQLLSISAVSGAANSDRHAGGSGNSVTAGGPAADTAQRAEWAQRLQPVQDAWQALKRSDGPVQHARGALARNSSLGHRVRFPCDVRAVTHRSAECAERVCHTLFRIKMGTNRLCACRQLKRHKTQWQPSWLKSSAVAQTSWPQLTSP
jgi:Dynein heavy chain AAA lid domain